MTTYDEALTAPLTTDDEVLARVDDLIGRAARRQLWLLLVDEDGVQLPQILPMDLPPRVRRRDADGYAAFLSTVVAASGAAEIVVVLERPGGQAIVEADRAWLRFVAEAARRAEVPISGPVLSHTSGVRWAAADDWAM